MKRITLILLIMVSATITLRAAWLDYVPQKITQPDGAVINCFASGDEFYHWLHDQEGYTIVLNPVDGGFYYGIQRGEKVVPSNFLAGSVNPAGLGIEKWIKISSRLYQERRAQFQTPLKSLKDAPTTGTVNNLSVYISFADDSVFGRNRGWFLNRYSGEDTVSLKDYFHEVSYERLFLNTFHLPNSPDTIHITYVDTFPRRYFLLQSATNPDGYPDGTQGTREHALLERALKSIEAQLPAGVNFDANDDGRIDNVCFVMQGAAAGWSDLLWPHRWALYSRDVRLNGKRVWDYLLMLENGFNVGTLCHEFFHVLGAPDLYHYNSNGSPSPCGAWDIMESNQNPPQYMCAFMKYKYGDWIANIPWIEESGTYTLFPLQNPDQNSFRIRSPLHPQEYFVVEYRKREGRYDTSAPNTGLVVYRINPAAGNGNAQGPPDEVYVYRPGGTLTVNGTLSSASFGQANRRAINDKTDPSSFLYNGGRGGAGGLDIFNISDSGGDSITFEINYIPKYPPQELTYSLTEEGVNLVWHGSFAAGFKEYYVYRNGTKLMATRHDYYTDNAIVHGEIYTYYVTAFYEGAVNGESDPSNQVVAVPLGIQSLPYSEDFETMAHGWIIKNNIDGFRWGDAGWFDMISDNQTHYLAAISEKNGQNAHTTDYAISPRLNLLPYSQVTLSFDYSLKIWQRLDKLKIHFRPTKDHNWTQLIDLPNSGYGSGYKWRHFSIELPADALSDQVQIGFQYDDSKGFAYGGGLDNIEIKEPAAGTDPQAMPPAVTIYPNPAGDKTHLHLNFVKASEARISLISLDGRVLWEWTVQNPQVKTEEIHLESVPSGLYYLMIETDQEVVLRKLIRQ